MIAYVSPVGDSVPVNIESRKVAPLNILFEA